MHDTMIILSECSNISYIKNKLKFHDDSGHSKIAVNDNISKLLTRKNA